MNDTLRGKKNANATRPDVGTATRRTLRLGRFNPNPVILISSFIHDKHSTAIAVETQFQMNMKRRSTNASRSDWRVLDNWILSSKTRIFLDQQWFWFWWFAKLYILAASYLTQDQIIYLTPAMMQLSALQRCRAALRLSTFNIFFFHSHSFQNLVDDFRISRDSHQFIAVLIWGKSTLATEAPSFPTQFNTLAPGNFFGPSWFSSQFLNFFSFEPSLVSG